MHRYVRRGTWVLAACGGVLLSSCTDPERAALKIFSDQGLTVLRPVRDYVMPGGLVIWPSGGRPEYVDPLDAAAVSETKDFTSIIHDTAKKHSAKFSIVLGLVEKMMPMAVGVSATSTGDVKLTQIDAPGKRVTFPDVTSLIRAPTTEALLFEELKAGARAFVVQEVYSSNSLTLSSVTGGSLGASLRGEKIMECGSAPPSDAEEDKKQAPPPTSSTGEGGAPSATPATPPVKPGMSTAGSATANSNASTAGGAPSVTKEATDPTKVLKPSGAVGVCIEKAYSLKFTSKERLPFAVRLMEVVLVPGAPGKALKVRIGSFKFPNSLGNSDVEKATFVDPAHPVLESLERRTTRSKGTGK
jgi:hypothetical protein